MSPPSEDNTQPEDTTQSQTPARALEAFLAEARRRVAIEEAPFWKEVAAFNQMPSPVVDQYYGQYVAVYNGSIVDADADEAELALRFYRTWGYVPVYIHQVGTEDGLIDADEEMQ